MKNYIGKGKKKQYSVQVSIDMKKARPFLTEYKGGKYLNFEVSENKEPDQYGNTHSVYVWTPDERNENPTNGKDTVAEKKLPF